MLQDILMAIPLGLLLCFMIGPVFFIVIETAVTKGFRAAIVFDLGVVTADLLFITIAISSSYRLIENLQDQPALFIFGGLIMVSYGFISFIKLKKVAKNIDENDEIPAVQRGRDPGAAKRQHGPEERDAGMLRHVRVGTRADEKQPRHAAVGDETFLAVEYPRVALSFRL